ncbi:hypothetical protein [Flavobacterium sp.]|uniref:hypothetical protein n=1 Tax=Flavobacterium sp. TaxID=239 RepID=UPI00260C1E5F|nr:hypothetical protein [Flavobacterium sp.]
MKTIKLFCFLLAVCSFTVSSCSDASPIENNTAEAQKSVALRTTIFELRKANQPGDRSANNSTKAHRLTPVNPFCFEFLYPLVLSYNNGTAITVTSSEGLWQIIDNESPTLFLDGIVFPFQVVQNLTTVTINSESEFIALINNCGFNNLYDEIHNTYCFDIVFPITLNYNGQVVTINSEEELLIFGDAPGFDGAVNIVFPISVMYQGQTVQLNTLYDFYQMAANCTGDCICTLEYAPVCVQTPNGIVEYGNLCFAQCAGYTQNDLVPCNPVSECSITNLTATPGTCNPATFQYPVTIDFNSGNTTATQFEVYSSSNALLGVYPIASLPVTIENYPESILGAPNLNLVTVKINENNENCTATQSFTIPNCANCICTTDYLPVCVQSGGQIVEFSNACLARCAGYTSNDFVSCLPATFNFMESLGTCFNIMYPVTVQYQGALVTVNSNSELVQYYNPQTQKMPIMNYPIAVTWGVQTATFTYANQISFETAIILANCP